MYLQPWVLQEASVVFHVRACCLIEFAPRFFANKVWDGAQIKFASEENDEKSSSSFRMDVIWGYLSSLKLGNGTHKFGRMNDVAKTVLIPPHSNASKESCVSYKETQIKQHFGSISPGGWYVVLFAYYQNGQQRVIF